MNKYKKFIKEAYNGKLGFTMCQDWKQKIESEFPELLPKKQILILEVGRWYINQYGSIFCFNGNYEGEKYPCGFGSYTNSWTDDGRFSDFGLSLATKEEITQALIKEAEERGFKEGVKFKMIQGFVGKVNKHKIDGAFYYDSYQNRLMATSDDGTYTIFHNGTWAEIIPNTMTREEAEKQLNAKIID